MKQETMGNAKGPLYNPNYKMQYCKKYSKHGKCPYGHKCQFAHGINEYIKWKAFRDHMNRFRHARRLQEQQQKFKEQNNYKVLHRKQYSSNFPVKIKVSKKLLVEPVLQCDNDCKILHFDNSSSNEKNSVDLVNSVVLSILDY